MTENIPLWLDLKKEYIDDNFEQFLKYLFKNSYNGNSDSFYLQTISLLSDRAADLLREIESRPVCHEGIAPDKLSFNVRLLGAYIHTVLGSKNIKEPMLALILELSRLVPKYEELLSSLAMTVLKSEDVTTPGFSFRDLIKFPSEISSEIFAEILVRRLECGHPLRQRHLFENHGRAWLDDSGLRISATGESVKGELQTFLVDNVDTGDGCSLASRPEEKLKLSEAGSLQAINAFVKDFIARQYAPPKEEEVRKWIFGEGDSTVVMITNIIWNGDILVETVDPRYGRVKGKIIFTMKNVGGYFPYFFSRLLQPGCLLPVTVCSVDPYTFSFESQFIDFLNSDLSENYSIGDTLCARLMNTTPELYYWLTEQGITLVSSPDSDFSKGMLADLVIEEFGSDKKYGRAYIAGESDVDPDDFVDNEVRQDCVNAFCHSVSVPESGNRQPEPEFPPLQEGVLRLVSRIFYNHQRSLLRPSERFRYLSAARVLSVLVDDPLSASYLEFISSYLIGVVDFASGKDISGVSLVADEKYAGELPVKLRIAVLRLLKEYGGSSDPAVFDAIKSSYPEDNTVLTRLASLIQAANSIRTTAGRPLMNILRREMIRTLSIDTDGEVDLEADGKPCIGSEGQTVEFKTSIVFPPDNGMQPDQTLQTRNVFRGICAFLNSMLGGTLYIGVNDSGYVSGLRSDFEFLRCSSFDTYARLHIQDPLKECFGEDVLTYIHIDEAFDGQVAVIRVDPYPYGVVELDHVAYLRVDRESVRMSDRMKQEMMRKKLSADSNRMKNILQLWHAVNNRNAVVLHAYSSSKGGSISNRTVEPYRVCPDHGMVMCFDLKDNVSKVFAISRIGYVEILEREWQNSGSHEDIILDAFHTSGDADIPVSLELDLFARNLLVEEFPLAKNDISPCKGNDNVWYYDGTVRSLAGLARFYIGLANHIKILDCPPLIEYVANFRATHL